MSCPFCKKPLTAVVRRYPCSMVCYGHDRMGSDGCADYTDWDCTTKDCPRKGPVYSSAGGVDTTKCYICNEYRFRDLSNLEIEWAEIWMDDEEGSTIYSFHVNCQPKD